MKKSPGVRCGANAGEDRVDGLAGRHHHEQGARRGERSQERRDVGRRGGRAAAGLLLEAGDGRLAQVEAGDGDAGVERVEGEVAAHHAEADDAEREVRHGERERRGVERDEASDGDGFRRAGRLSGKA